MKLAVLGGVALVCATTAVVVAQGQATAPQVQTVIGCVRGEGTTQSPWILAGVVIPPPVAAPAGRGRRPWRRRRSRPRCRGARWRSRRRRTPAAPRAAPASSTASAASASHRSEDHGARHGAVARRADAGRRRHGRRRHAPRVPGEHRTVGLRDLREQLTGKRKTENAKTQNAERRRPLRSAFLLSRRFPVFRFPFCVLRFPFYVFILSNPAAFPPRIATCSAALNPGVCSTVSTGVLLAIGNPKSVPMTTWLAPATVTTWRRFCGL